MVKQTFDKAFGWISVSSIYAKPWELSYAVNIDVTKYPDRVVWGEQWTDVVQTNNREMTYSTEAVSLTGSTLAWFFWEGGEIYSANSSDNTPERTTNNPILAWAKLWWFIFMLHSVGNDIRISRVGEDAAAQGSLTWFAEDVFIHDTWESAFNEYIWMTTFWNASLVIWRWNKIYVILVDEDGWLTIDNTTTVWASIAWVTTSTSNIKVYTTLWDIVLYNTAYARISSVPTDVRMTNIKTVNNTDFAIWPKWLYRTNWNNLVPLFLNWYNDVFWELKTLPLFPIIFDGNKIWFTLQQEISWTIKRVMASLGTDIIWFPEAITITELWTGDSVVTSWTQWRLNFYASVVDNGVEKIVSKNNAKVNNVSGKLYYEEFNASNTVTQKELNEITINGKFTSSTAKVLFNGIEQEMSVPLSTWWIRDVIKTNEFTWSWSRLVILIELDWDDECFGVEIDYDIINR